jgi:hypothetical protein
MRQRLVFYRVRSVVMANGVRRGGIPGPESRTGLVRPTMTEAEFERRQNSTPPPAAEAGEPTASSSFPPAGTTPMNEPESAPRARSRATRTKTVKLRRVQRMFALEEELDKKLWLYAIHIGKDRSDVVNDLLRPVVASMVLYDSRDRRSARVVESESDRTGDGEGGGGQI